MINPPHNYKEPFVFRGATLLPVESLGCNRCAAKPSSDELRCGDLPECSYPDASVQWVHDTPENRVDYILWRMK